MARQKNLSTFNSNILQQNVAFRNQPRRYKMISKSIITAFLLCLAYSMIAYLNLDSEIRPLNQGQGNLVKCQEYVFRDSAKAKYVITGSSMSYRLRQEFLPPGYYNLALGGHSSFLGLELVNRSPDLPEVVFVEMNTIVRSTNSPFVDDIFSRPIYDMKKHVVITRDKFRFFPFLVNKAHQFVSENDATDNNVKIDEATLKKRIDVLKESFCKLPNENKLKASFSKLRQLVAELESKNVRVVFFEMPMHSEIYSSELFTVLNNEFKKNFPESKYHYIPAPPSDGYDTTDGLHLVASCAKKMANYLVAQFNQGPDPNLFQAND